MKKTSLFIVLFMAAFGTFIGLDYNGTNGSVAASPPIVFPEMPQPVNQGPLNLSVDLETGHLTVDNARNSSVNVNVEHPVTEMPPKYITVPQLVEKEVYVENKTRSNKLMNRAAPLGNPAPLMP